MTKTLVQYILGSFGNCTSSNPCGEDEGDCNNDDECKIGHKCGTDNCRSTLGYESFYDCCDSIEEDLCTIESPCGVNEGDCDSHNVCQGHLMCGYNNCPESLNYASEVDCCYELAVGDEDFCSKDYPCGPEEGDCDFDDECQAGLVCNTVTDCSSNFGLDDHVDCCQIGMYKAKIIYTLLIY